MIFWLLLLINLNSLNQPRGECSDQGWSWSSWSIGVIIWYSACLLVRKVMYCSKQIKVPHAIDKLEPETVVLLGGPRAHALAQVIANVPHLPGRVQRCPPPHPCPCPPGPCKHRPAAGFKAGLREGFLSSPSLPQEDILPLSEMRSSIQVAIRIREGQILLSAC